jgi:hypothetical protein
MNIWIVVKSDCIDCGGDMGLTVFSSEPSQEDIDAATPTVGKGICGSIVVQASTIGAGSIIVRPQSR